MTLIQCETCTEKRKKKINEMKLRLSSPTVDGLCCAIVAHAIAINTIQKYCTDDICCIDVVAWHTVHFSVFKMDLNGIN